MRAALSHLGTLLILSLGALFIVNHQQLQDPAETTLKHFTKTSPWHSYFDRVLYVGIDGFGGLYMENATSHMPFFLNSSELDFLVENYRVRNQQPAVSAPNWSTQLTGMPPTQTGVFANTWDCDEGNGNRPPRGDCAPPNVTAGISPLRPGWGHIPTSIFTLAKQSAQRNISTGFVSGWAWNYILARHDCDYINPNLMNRTNTTMNLAKEMSSYIRAHAKDRVEGVGSEKALFFIHIEEVDHNGHTFGWGSPEYYAAVDRADTALQQLWKTLERTRRPGSRDLLLVTADHGGHDNWHGAHIAADIYVPLIAAIAPSKSSLDLDSESIQTSRKRALSESEDIPITTLDLVPTALDALGLWKDGRSDLFRHLRGRSVFEI